MKANYDQMPSPIEPVGNGSFLINYNIEEVTKEDRTSFDCDQVLIWNEPTREKIISAIVREKYSQDHVEAITANYLAGHDTQELAAFQVYREVAKKVASGIYLKTDIAIDLITPAIDRISELEVTTTAVIEVLTDKGITP